MTKEPQSHRALPPRPRAISAKRPRRRDTATDSLSGRAPSFPVEDDDFPVVGIGASAGGLEAFRKLFEGLPAETGMAFVLIQHLDPTHESTMAEILGRHTSVAVVQARPPLATGAG